MGTYCFNYVYSKNTLANEIFKSIKQEGQEQVFANDPQTFIDTLVDGDQSTVDIIRKTGDKGFNVFNAPKLKEMGNDCFKETDLEEFRAPELASVGTKCFDQSPIRVFESPIEVQREGRAILTGEDKKLFDMCFSAVENAQNRYLGIDSPEKSETTTQQISAQDTTGIEVTTGAEPASAVVTVSQFDVEKLTEDARRDLESFIKLENGATGDLTQTDDMHE